MRLYQRLMNYNKLTDDGRNRAAAIFRDQMNKLGVDPDGKLDADGIACELFKWELRPPRVAERDNPLEEAVKRAETDPIRFKRSAGPLFDKVGSIAIHLHDIALECLEAKGEKTYLAPHILLPQPALEKLLGKDQGNISRAIASLVAYGIIHVVEAKWKYRGRQAKVYALCNCPHKIIR